MAEKDYKHDEIKYTYQPGLTNDPKVQPITYRKNESEQAKPLKAIEYGRQVGGGSVHFTANYWRFHESDFEERSQFGDVRGRRAGGLADQVRRSGTVLHQGRIRSGHLRSLAGANPFEAPRSKPYPLPPMPVKSSGVLFDRATKKLGLHPYPAPMAILSQPYQGRAACVHCGFCESFGCEMRAKSSTLVSVIPIAEKTGRCEIRPNSYVRKIETDAQRSRDRRGLFRCESPRSFPAREGGGAVRQWRRDRALAAAVEIEALSAGARQLERAGRQVSDVGQRRPGDGAVRASAERVQKHSGDARDPRLLSRGPQARLLRRRRDSTRASITIRPNFALHGMPPDAPKWGAEYKKMLGEYFTHTMTVLAHTSSLPQLREQHFARSGCEGRVGIARDARHLRLSSRRRRDDEVGAHQTSRDSGGGGRQKDLDDGHLAGRT